MAARKPTPDAMDIVDEMSKSVTLNKFFDNNPSRLSDDDLRDLIDFNRRERAQRVEKDSD